MTIVRNNELVFEVTQECLTESIVTQGDSWEDLRAMVIDAVDAYFFDGPKPQAIRLHLVRNEVLLVR